MTNTAIFQLQKKQQAEFQCTKCGADRFCDCNAPALKKLAEFEDKKERDRQSARSRMQRNRDKKDEENQSSVRERSGNNATRAEARCAAQWEAFTAEEKRTAVSSILEAIRDLTDEQRALLFQTLKDSYQWTT